MHGALPEIERYNLHWPAIMEEAKVEIEMIRHGGRWKKKNGESSSSN